MCRLLGASFAEPAPLRAEWLEAFAGLAATGIVSEGSTPGHQDGWGVAGMVSGVATRYARQPASILADPAALDAARRAMARVPPDPVMAHLRKASPGLAVSEVNTHPFRIGRTLFCHNGSIRHPERFPVALPGVIHGTTDSERWFAYLLERCGAAPDDRFTGLLADAIRASRDRSEASSWTFLLARGSRLWAYREASARRYAPDDEAGAECLRTHTLWLARADAVQLCCSEPLPGVAPWSAVENRELVVLEHGTIGSRQIV